MLEQHAHQGTHTAQSAAQSASAHCTSAAQAAYRPNTPFDLRLYQEHHEVSSLVATAGNSHCCCECQTQGLGTHAPTPLNPSQHNMRSKPVSHHVTITMHHMQHTRPVTCSTYAQSHATHAPRHMQHMIQSHAAHDSVT